jgi:hypothetical protein
LADRAAPELRTHSVAAPDDLAAVLDRLVPLRVAV